jgi:hypothetical protein
MRGLLTLLLYAGFFYLMMRFSCGVRMVQGTVATARENGV